jgi:uncharacterized protein YtpQ (UPF0354 family)
MLSLLLSIAVVPQLGAQEIVPTDETAFTTFALEKLQQALPLKSSAKVTGPLSIQLTGPDGESLGQANLDRVWAFCSRSRERCSAALNQYVAGIAGVVKDRTQPIEKSMVRLALRPQPYIERARNATGNKIIARPFAAELWLIAVLDFPRAIRPVIDTDLKKLGIAEDEVIALGRRNLAESLRPLSSVVQPIPEKAIRYLADHPYESSRLIFHSEWAEVAKGVGGQLIVAVPEPNSLLYGNGSTLEGVDAFRTFVLDATRKSQSPLSPTVFKWTPAGWEEIK